jgi:hypothetical protein
MEPVTLEDKRIIAAQLGRAARGLLRVERRCPYGYPQVILVHPLIEGKPFPTTFWLTCPFLAEEIDHLEEGGWIKKMETLLREDTKLNAQLQRAHRAYIEERMNLLSVEDRRFLDDSRMSASLLEKGIGGIGNFNRIKCLHLHVAHALARENPIGEIVLKALPSRACSLEHVICASL